MSRRSNRSGLGSNTVAKMLQSKDSSSSSSSSEEDYSDFSDTNDNFVVGEEYEDAYRTGKETQAKSKKKEAPEGTESIESFLAKTKNKQTKQKTKSNVSAVDTDKANDILNSFMNQEITSSKSDKKKKSNKSNFAQKLALQTNKKFKKELSEKSVDIDIPKRVEKEEEKPATKIMVQPKQISESVAKRLAIEAPIELPDVELDKEIETTYFATNQKKNQKAPTLNKGKLRIFMYHIFEDTRGFLYLFGKTLGNVTVCIKVTQPYRVVYFLPRDPNKIQETKDAINKKLRNEAILQDFSGFYAFDSELPYNAKWIKALIPSKYSSQILQEHFPQSSDVYTRVFHLTSDLIESFMMGNKIYGPCWVDVSELVLSNSNLCDCPLYEIKPAQKQTSTIPVPQVTVLNEAEREKLRTPLFNISTVAFRTKYDQQHKESHICMISVQHSFNFEINSFEPFDKRSSQSLITFVLSQAPQQESKRIKIQYCKTESELLNKFLEELSTNDIDMVLGYDLNNFASQVLCDRLKKLKVGRPFRLGRINKDVNPKDPLNIFCGRLPVDLRVCADEFMRVKANDFSSVVADELDYHPERPEFNPLQMDQILVDSGKIEKLAIANVNDTRYIKDLAKTSQVIPLTLQIAQISGAQWARVLVGKASPRSEALLAHQFTDRNYIIPDKSTEKGSGKRGDAQFQGGHVLDPIVGFHEHCILLLDYNSLYPSIIRQYDLCFATCLTKEKHQSVLPKIMEELLEARKAIKRDIKKNDDLRGHLEIEMKELSQSENEEQKSKLDGMKQQMKEYDHTARLLDIKQKAVKILANAMYGYLGYKGSRFPATSIAEIITKRGREALDKVINIVNTTQYTYRDENNQEITLSGFKIVYGDTDSVMVDSNTTDVKLALDIAKFISSAVNQKFKDEAKGKQYMELGIDGIFLKMLLVSKKKYAALLYRGEGLEPELQLKGLDMVRRDWCPLMKYCSYYVINKFMDYNGDTDSAVQSILNELKRISEMLNTKFLLIKTTNYKL